MFSPFLVLYVKEFITGGDEIVVGIALSIYLVSRSLLQIPVATFIDKVKGEKDDYALLITFSFIAGLLNLALLAINQVWQLFLFEFLIGLATAVTYPSYMAIFTRHIDKHMEGTEWGVYYTFTDLGGAILATLGGFVAKSYGLSNLVILTTSLCLLGSTFLIPIKPYLKKLGVYHL
jgi:MFS family permease